MGKTNKIDSIIIRWLDDKENVLRNVPANQAVKVNYKEATPGINRTPVYHPAFKESTQQILSQPFVHKENKYNEYIKNNIQKNKKK